MSRPFVYVGAAMFISLFVFSCLGIPAAAVLFVISAIVSVPVFILRNKNEKCKTVLCICIAVLISSVLFSAKTVHDYLPATALCDDNKHTVSGTVAEYEKQYGHYYYVIDNCVIDGKPIKQQIRVRSDAYKNAQVDDVMTCADVYIYELGTNKQVGLSYKANGIYLGAYAYDSVITVQDAQNHSVFYFLQSLRHYITQTLNANMPDESAAVINALLTGNDSAIENDTLLNFRYSGVSHLFAVSGFHLALWTAMLSAIFSKIFKKHNLVACVVSILFVVFFMALTGFSKSVVRAGIMLIIMLSGKIIYQLSDSLNSLFIAVSLILAVNPFAATSMSLQMSFLATLGIIIFSEPLIKPIRALKWKIPRFLYNVILTVYSCVAFSVVATIFTMPVTAVNFGYYSPVSFVSGVLCMPASQILMPLSAVAIISAPINFISGTIFALCNLLAKYLISVTSVIGHSSYAVTDADNPVVMALILIIFFTTIVFFLVFKDRYKILRICIAVSAAAMFLLSASVEIIQSNAYEICVADIGNGMSVVLRTGKTDVIIGCGGNSYDYYKFTNIAEKVNERVFDLIIIPGNSKEESLYAEDVLESYTFRSCIISDEDVLSRISKSLPENTEKTSETTVVLDENTTLVYINNGRFSGARIESPDFTATIVFSPTSDFSEVEEKWQSGNLLITHQKLPQINTDGFENVVISTSLKRSYDAGNIFSTDVLGSIRYIKFPWGGVSVYAV